jgi:hypothetical protein
MTDTLQQLRETLEKALAHIEDRGGERYDFSAVNDLSMDTAESLEDALELLDTLEAELKRYWRFDFTPAPSTPEKLR